MGGFRGSDDTLEREIAALEAVGRTRLKRYARDLDGLTRELAQLRRERARRKAEAGAAIAPTVSAEAAGAVGER